MITKKITPANILFINPQVAFSANDRISLLAGATLRNIGSQKINDTIISKSRNNTDISLGVGYGLSDNSNLNFIATIKQNFETSNEFRISYHKKF